ncbi:MAG: zeta toxin family protein [Clostridiales bacterium]|nr:zeta toxin family protein [Clostridiales bacterium]
MIILIGGNGHTGKTYLAQKLLEKIKMPYLCIDHLKMGLYRGLGDEKYSPIQSHNVLGKTLWPIVKGIIMTAIENKQNLIIEGCYILPHFMSDFDKDYAKEITSVFLGFSEDYIRNNFKKIEMKMISPLMSKSENIPFLEKNAWHIM